MRISATDGWCLLHGSSTTKSGFIRFLPDLKKTPPIVTKPPTKTDAVNVTSRFESEEYRINNSNKMAQLYELRDKVFQSRTESLHWNLNEIVELNTQNEGEKHNDTPDNITEQGHIDTEDEIMPDPQKKTDNVQNRSILELTKYNQLSYELNEFVAVMTEGDKVFWIGKVVKVLKSVQGVITKLKLHWYEPYNSKDIISGKYMPGFLKLDKKNKSKAKPSKRTAWTDEVSVECVILKFSSLTSKGLIPVSCRKKLHQEITTLGN